MESGRPPRPPPPLGEAPAVRSGPSRPQSGLRGQFPGPSSFVLRKSFSADSFSSTFNHGHNQQLHMANWPQTAIPAPRPDADSPAAQPQNPSAHPRDVRYPLSTRSRGASISTVASVSLTDDSDNELERVPPAKPPRHKLRSRQDSNPALVLPSKIAAPASSQHPPSHISTNPAPTSRPLPPGLVRSRSESLTLSSASLDYFASKPDRSEISIVVVGCEHCGKSTVVDKGLKQYRLGKPTLVPPPDHSGPFTYAIRDGHIPREGLPDRVLRVLEANTKVFLDAQHPDGHFVWPPDAPPIDAAIVCYDASDRDSIAHIEHLTRCFRDLRLPVVVFACKFDLERRVESSEVHALIKQFDVGIVEVNTSDDHGKLQIRLAFQFVIRAVVAQRAGRMSEATNFNPASPDVLVSPPPWDISRASTATPTAASISTIPAPPTIASAPSSAPPSSSTPRSPTSPTRSRSASDLNSIASSERARELDRSRSTLDMASRANGVDGLAPPPPPPLLTDLPSVDEVSEDRSDTREKEGRPAPWATLDELLEKLLFLAVSGDDSAFISHFLLTYRRFASPRSVILAMQKRMRWLDQPCADPIFACFAQMRICHLLEVWIQDYPHDFAVGHAAGALNALVRSIVSKTHLLHYGSDFLPFLEGRPLVDKDAAWAVKLEESTGDEHEEQYAPFEESDYEEDGEDDEVMPPSAPQTASRSSFPLSTNSATARERKSSLPLTAKVLMDPEAARLNPPFAALEQDLSPKVIIRELQNIAQQLDRIDSEVIAQEITRIGAKLFMAIEPRHWLQHTLVSGPKDSESDTIARFLEVSYHLAEWVVSLLLCHDRISRRVRQVEKFIEVAGKLRFYNNYSALRAFVAGIRKVMGPDDELTEQFKARHSGMYKSFQSWEVLLQSARSHRAYRMALHNTKGACVPAVEVHLQDLIKAHEGNPDVHADDPTRIHWAKFNMMGKFIQSTTDFQAKCRTSIEYQFRDSRDHAIVRQLLMRECKMDQEMQRARLGNGGDWLDQEEKSAWSVTKRLLRRT